MADISQRQTRQAAKSATVASGAANDNVPATQRGGVPVVQNPTAVDKETAKTLPKNIQESLENQAQVKKPSEKNFDLQNEQELENNSFQENERTANYPVLDFENEEQEVEEENKNEEKNYYHKPRFPGIVFCICILEWFGSMLFGILSLILIIPPFTPIGGGLNFVILFFEIIFSAYIFTWSVWYEGKETRSFKKATMDLKKQKIIKRSSILGLGRRSILGINIIPLLNYFIPVNAIFVLRTYTSVKKDFNKRN